MEKRLSDAISKVAWGYLLIHFNINFGVFDLLPDWLGYILFYMAIQVISEEEMSTKLLQPLVVVFGIWDVVSIFIGDIRLVSLIITALSLYFHFQFLTNLANVAEKNLFDQKERILLLRTLRTILITVFAIPLPWDELGFVSLVLLIANAVVAVLICMVMFSFRKWIKTLEFSLSGTE